MIEPMEYGTSTLRMYLARLKRKTFATSRWSCGTLPTPKAVLIMVGQRAVMAMVNTAAGGVIERAARAIGNQASGETGRSTWMMGLVARRTGSMAPTAKPRGIPTAAARAKPV